MYDVWSKVLSKIKSMHVDSSAGVKVKGSESKRFRIDRGARQGKSCILGCPMYIWME